MERPSLLDGDGVVSRVGLYGDQQISRAMLDA
jgi:hypothetical protein